MDSKALEAALVEAAAAAEAHTASLAERLAAVRAAPGGGASAEAARWAAEARDWHASQAARWGGVLVASGGGLCAALGDGKYAPIASEALTAMRPDPPGGRSAPSAAAVADGDPALTAAESEYQAIRTQLKNAMKLNPLVGEMQQTVTRRMHAVPALGSVPLPKKSVYNALHGTGSAAARDITTAQLEASMQQSIPSAAGGGSGGGGVPSWKAELQARQSQVNGGAAPPAARAAPSAPRPSAPSGLNSELEAALARRRSSAQQT
eukprot:jgi/Tetstr1/443841/TSEL_031795.t1